jgi:ATP-binding cassette subfamily D (ALD) long-chain fatty acid import protein
MANQSTLRPMLSSLLQQYLALLRKAPKYSRVLVAAVLAAVVGGYYQKRRLARKRAEERQGRVLIRRNSEVRLNDGLPKELLVGGPGADLIRNPSDIRPVQNHNC